MLLSIPKATGPPQLRLRTGVEQYDSLQYAQLGPVHVQSFHFDRQLAQDAIEQGVDAGLLGTVPVQRKVRSQAHQLRLPDSDAAIVSAVRWPFRFNILRKKRGRGIEIEITSR